MKRIARYILNALTLLSLVLSAATVALWIAGHRQPLEFGWYSSGPADEADSSAAARPAWQTSQQGLVSALGRIALGRYDYTWAGDGSFAAGHRFYCQRSMTFGFTGTTWQFLGLRRSYQTGLLGQLIFTNSAVSAPACLIALAAALLPAGRAARALANHAKNRTRARAGRCPACGYDLRATPDRCPECGRVPTEPGD